MISFELADANIQINLAEDSDSETTKREISKQILLDLSSLNRNVVSMR